MCRQGECGAKTGDLRARMEAKVSKDHLTACLESKANDSELVELRGRLGRYDTSIPNSNEEIIFFFTDEQLAVQGSRTEALRSLP